MAKIQDPHTAGFKPTQNIRTTDSISDHTSVPPSPPGKNTDSSRGMAWNASTIAVLFEANWLMAPAAGKGERGGEGGIV